MEKTENIICPRCNAAELVCIEGKIVRWLTCPKCRFAKLLEKEEKGIGVTGI